MLHNSLNYFPFLFLHLKHVMNRPSVSQIISRISQKWKMITFGQVLFCLFHSKWSVLYDGTLGQCCNDSKEHPSKVTLMFTELCFASANVIHRMIHRPFVAWIKSPNQNFLALMRPVSQCMSVSVLDLQIHHTSVIVHIRVERYSKRSQSTGAKSPAWYACYGWGEEVILITQTVRNGSSVFSLHNSECHFINIQFTVLFFSKLKCQCYLQCM